MLRRQLEPKQVTTIKRWIAQQRVHNLTIANVHTYYVLSGTTPILVHNSNGCEWDVTKLDEKYDKHVFGDGKRPGEGPDMPEYQDEVDGFDRYQRDACTLMCGPKGPNVREVVRSGDGAVLRLDTSTGRLGIKQNGKITNFFRPDNPLAYMENESGR